VSCLKSQETHLSVKDFPERFLPPDLRDTFANRFRKIKFPPRNVPKDIKDIRRRLQVRRMVFSSRVKISAPEDEFDTLVQIVGEGEGWTTVKISSSLEEQV